MEPLITVKDVAERYKCSLATARKYIRKCNPHMENPLCVYERDFCKWEVSRLAYHGKMMSGKEFDNLEKQLREGKIFVPRRRT